MISARKTSLARPGVTGTARVGPTAEVLSRLRPGDVAVLDHGDLDRDTAHALVATGVRLVVNAAPSISGHYANAGPEVLAEAGVLLVDRIGPDGLESIRDGQLVRVHGGVVFDASPLADADHADTDHADTDHAEGGDTADADIADADDDAGPDGGDGEVLAKGRDVDVALLHEEMAAARGGLVEQLDTLTHTTSEFLCREQELLLNGHGLPELTTRLSGRPVVVVARADHEELRALRQFVREQSPTLVAVGSATDDLMAESWVPDIVVVTAGDPRSVPSADGLRGASDVVLLAQRGAGTVELHAIEAAGVTPHLVDSTATAEDIALLLADRDDAELVVGVGLHARLEDFLDQEQSGGASTFATRLKVGSRLVDATAVRTLYAGRPQPVHTAVVVLAGLVALVAALSVTAVGQQWVSDVVDYLQGLM